MMSDKKGRTDRCAELERLLAAKSEELERLKEEMLESEERYKIALEETNDVIIEFDMVNRKMTVDREKFYALFHAEPKDKFTENVLFDIDAMAHPDDRERVKETFRLPNEGENLPGADNVRTLDYRIKGGADGWIWVRGTLIPIRNKRGKVVKMMGNIKNIDEAKRREIEILNRSRRDALTGMWNRVRTEELVNRALREEGGAMLVADIDDFKLVNDTLGHLLGDAVIRDVASKIKAEFDERGVVGRIGGDEFLLFLPGARSAGAAMLEAEKLSAVFSSEKLRRTPGHNVSGSIGVALAPQDGTSYTELFQRADHALYHAKNCGKGVCVLYESGMRAERYINPEKMKIDSVSAFAPDNIIRYIFQILYETADIETAIDLILKIVGETFDVSRVYIFENTPDNQYCNNTYEWCAEGISEEKKNLQKISYDELHYRDYFNENGIFYCEDVSKLRGDMYDILCRQGVHSLLQCCIMEGGVMRGFVGFDECKSSRLWNSDEIDVLTFISRIISTFMLKQRSQQDLLLSRKRLRDILDGLDLWVYIIDPDTYELLYRNRKTSEIAPEAKTGCICYRVLRGKEAPCADCPMRHVLESGTSCTWEIHNEKLDVWTNATASLMTWEDGKQVCLMTCTDITPYKRKEKR